MNFTKQDRTYLRDLAKRVAEIADMPIQAERIALWKRHNSLERPRPMILIFPEGAWRELCPEENMRFAGMDHAARWFEMSLLRTIYQHEHFDCDNVVTKDWPVGKRIFDVQGWGLEAKWHMSDDPTGARAFDPILKTADDLKKLTLPVIDVDEETSQKDLEFVQDLFGDILNVYQTGQKGISFHLMNRFTALHGLEQTMLDMYENPQFLHDAMAILEEGNRKWLQQLVDLNLLSVNNDNTYQSSGGNGWTDELPAAGFDPGRVRLCDMWGSAEAQEMAQVSPEMHDEFILQYERRLLEPFGLTGYGCCEDLTRKLDSVLAIPNMRRISISPWADVDKCAEILGNKAIFSWKPHPAHLCGKFDESAIREYIGHALDVTKDCVIEMVLKDTHTCENHPERFDKWSRIARELVEQY